MKRLLLSVLALGLSTMGYSQYCASNATSTGDSNIEDVDITGVSSSISNPTTNCTGYSDFTAQVVDLQLTQSYPISVLLSTCSSFEYNKYAKLYVDWNQDFDFTDPGELIAEVGTPNVAFTWNTNIVVPANASIGQTRMRIVCRESGSSFNTNSCGTFTWGETEDYTIDVIPAGLFAQLQTPNNPLLCNGDTTFISATGFFGEPPYDFDWSTGQSSTGVLADTLENVVAGTYTVTLTDSIGDDTITSITITEPTAITVNTTVETPLVCDYDISEVSVSGSGGVGWNTFAQDTAVANFAWDTSCAGVPVTFGGNNSVSGTLPIGFDFTYFGNTYDEFKIASNGFISFDEFVDDGCCGGGLIPDASTFQPNNAIYAAWDYWTAAFGDYSYCTTGEFPNRKLIVNFIDMPQCCGSLPNTTVQVILSEGSDCIEIQTATSGFTGNKTQGIENAAGDTAFAYPGRNQSNWTSDTSYIQWCPTDTAGLLYTWSNGQIGNNIQGLEAGTYTVSASDANGCVVTETVTINPAASNFESDLLVDNVSCFSFDDATVDPQITGGVAPITYTWDNGATSATLTDVEPGTYSVSAEDNLGCTIEVNNIIVTEPEILLGSIYGVEGVVCEGDSTGIASVVINGGTMPYTPTWSNGDIGMTSSGLGSGANFVQISDANGCELFVPVTIPFENPAPTPELGNNVLSSNGATVQLNTNPVTFAAYTWSTGETTTTIDVTETGVYWVQVANGAGCVGSDTVYVEIWPTGVEEMNTLTGVTFYPNPARDMINFDINSDIDELNVTITDVKGAIVATATYLNGGLATMDVANLPAGVYTLNMKSDELNATQRLVISK